jgi:hypothetical protein
MAAVAYGNPTGKSGAQTAVDISPKEMKVLV